MTSLVFFSDFFEPLLSSHFPRSSLSFHFLFTPLMLAGMHHHSRYHSLNLLHDSVRLSQVLEDIQEWLPETAYVAQHSSYQLPSTYVRTQQVSLHGSHFQASDRTLVVPARSSTRRKSYVFGHCGFDEPHQVNVRYVLLKEMFSSGCLSYLSDCQIPPTCHVRLNTEHIARVAKIVG